jgi:hypothetical protein
MAMTQQEQWVTMSEAAKKSGVSITKISNMANSGEIPSKDNPRDKRQRLVDLREVLRILGTA